MVRYKRDKVMKERQVIFLHYFCNFIFLFKEKPKGRKREIVCMGDVRSIKCGDSTKKRRS